MFVYVMKPPFVIENRRSYSVPVLPSCFPHVCRTKKQACDFDDL